MEIMLNYIQRCYRVKEKILIYVKIEYKWRDWIGGIILIFKKAAVKMVS